MGRFLRKLPDALCYARILLTGLTYGIVLLQDRAAFTVAVLVIVLTDILDGPLARRFGTAGRGGADLDSVSDFLFYASFPVWAWLFVPDVILIILPAIVVYFIAYVGAIVLARARLGQMGFHNAHTRLAGTAAVAFALVTILWGLQIPFLVAVLAVGAYDLFGRYRRILTARAPRPAPTPPVED